MQDPFLYQLLPSAWKPVFAKEKSNKRFLRLSSFVENKCSLGTCSPEQNLIFKALELVSPEEVKVVILGRDPYPNSKLACGLAFSAPSANNIPTSLRSIYSELGYDGDFDDVSYDLSPWTKEGVLLLNITLTIGKDGHTGSHEGKGWAHFTSVILAYLSNRKEPPVFLLWGRKAKEKADTNYLAKACSLKRVVKDVHPSYHGGSDFIGCGCFRKANELLNNPVDWKCVLKPRREVSC